ncbi:hypothetical protein CGRA01v4_14026 [Colletotrichum graminicola]|nr:hypothetical protein CGRA01v4_14026 [Colletotrichum graminicola]
MDQFARSAMPGAHLIDIFPILRCVPSWFPGTGWKKEVETYTKDLNESVERPYAFVEHQIAQGNNNESFLSRLMNHGKDTSEDKHTNKWVAASMYQGGSDTESPKHIYVLLTSSALWR